MFFAALILVEFSRFSLGAALAIPPVEPGQFHFHHENILGTSLDLIVRAESATTAAKAEQAALAELERLRKILSTYDPASEISRLNSAPGPMPCSPELLDVLNAYESWTTRSRGAYSGQLGELIATWRGAEKSGTPPPPSRLRTSSALFPRPAGPSTPRTAPSPAAPPIRSTSIL